MALIILTDTVTALAAARCRVQYDQPRANLICPHKQPASENKPTPERCPLVRDILRPDPIRPAQSFSLAPPADLASLEAAAATARAHLRRVHTGNV